MQKSQLFSDVGKMYLLLYWVTYSFLRNKRFNFHARSEIDESFPFIVYLLFTIPSTCLQDAVSSFVKGTFPCVGRESRPMHCIADIIV